MAAQAQEAMAAAGGNGTGAGGTVAYTVGQVVYTSAMGAGGQVQQGMQQAWEISSTLGIEDNAINLSLKAYPNPTTQYLTLSLGNTNLEGLSYQLFDITGKLLQQKKISSNSETIDMGNLNMAIYLLKVTFHGNYLKIFKIQKK